MGKRGPTSDRGRAAVRHNAVKHGLRSGDPVIPGFESFDEWESFRDGIIASYGPEGELETENARRIASLLWRLRRAGRYETEMTAHFLDDIPDDLAIAAEYGEKLGVPREDSITMDKIDKLVSTRLLPSKDTMERIIRYESHLRRMLHPAPPRARGNSGPSQRRARLISHPHRRRRFAAVGGAPGAWEPVLSAPMQSEQPKDGHSPS